MREVIDELSVRERVLGAEGAQTYAVAFNALHKFAQQTNCPLGGDVIGWFGHMTEVWNEAVAREHRLKAHPSKSMRGGE